MSQYYKNTEGLRRLLERGLNPDSPYRVHISSSGFHLDVRQVERCRLELMRQQLQRIQAVPDLPRDVHEVVSKSLEG